MQIKLEINTDNDAFQVYRDNPLKYAADMLEKLARELEWGRQPEKLRDINGNTAVKIEYLED